SVLVSGPLLHSPIGARQMKDDFSSGAEFGADVGQASRLFGKSVDLAQAEAGSLADGLGGEEGFENPFKNLGSNSGARVADDDLYEVAEQAAGFRTFHAPVAGLDGEPAT